MMIDKDFKSLANEAINYTKEGLNQLIEIDELLEALKNMKKNDDYYSLIKEIIKREKIAVSLIERATIIKRELLNRQKKEVANLYDSF